jgi:hypothetical protein
MVVGVVVAAGAFVTIAIVAWAERKYCPVLSELHYEKPFD